MSELTIRKTKVKNKVYWQLGRYENGKWVLVENLGRSDNVLELVRLGKEKKASTY